MRRRLTTFVLAAFYLLQATWLLHAGVDLLFPKLVEVVAAPKDACCVRTCGCPEEVQKANACCCVKDAPPAEASHGKPAPAPAVSEPRPVSAIEMARCQGAEAAMIQAFSQPVICAFADLRLFVVVDEDVLADDRTQTFPPLAVSVEKVPI